MSKQLDCEIIRDLLPGYADGQTSDITNKAIEEHIADCPECAEILRHMQEPEKDVKPEKKEIDYLKKVKKSKRFTAFIAASAVLLVSLLSVGYAVFVHGHRTDLNMQAVSVDVEGNTVHLDGTLTSSGEGVARVTFAEKDGTVDIELYTAPIMPFNHGSFSRTYTAASNAIRRVTSSGLVVYEDGEVISRAAALLYAAKNPYVGNMPANKAVADAIGISSRYGTYINELQTSVQPYGWTLILDSPVDAALEDRYRDRMLADACLMIAAVDNLDNVTWRYECSGEEKEYTVTSAQASEYAGGDIKQFADSASGMQKLMDTVR